jgi:hypothetical protein
LKFISVLVSNQYTFGHLLIVGYLSKDIVASWCSNIALAHLIADNQQFKEAILKVVLAIDQSQTGAKTLMEISLDLLENVDLKILFFSEYLFFLNSLHLLFIHVLLYSSFYVHGYQIVH